VGLISDAMYSDSHHVIDALAELIETTVMLTDEKTMSEGRRNQVRYIIQVDESTFQEQFSSGQLKAIETKEMEAIVDELISAIGLQRFRFTERQNNGTSTQSGYSDEGHNFAHIGVLLLGDHDVCRNLARIGASVCLTWVDVSACEQPRSLEPGAINLLMKAASHHSINICGIVLPVLSRIASTDASVAQGLLPILQRRAITPHHVNSGYVSLAASDLCGVNFHEFQNFREYVLTEALVACWGANGDNYMDSCTSAVEEFCSECSSVDVSLHLEAALFCIEAVSDDAFNGHVEYPHSRELMRCMTALSGRESSMMRNPLTLARMCTLLRKVSYILLHSIQSPICRLSANSHDIAHSIRDGTGANSWKVD
jgi:hypothetical protein